MKKISLIAEILLQKKSIDIEDYAILSDLLCVLNTIYESIGISIIDDDIYDKLQNLYQSYTDGVQYKNFITLDTSKLDIQISEDFNPSSVTSVSFNGYDGEVKKELKSLFIFDDSVLNTQKEIIHDTKMVGTLDKCKFILVNDVPQDLLNDPSVSILERDFFGYHIGKGIISPDEIINVVVELKYDGLSIVSEIDRGNVKSAITRGDLSQNTGANRINALKNKYFPKHYDEKMDPDFVKFEAIITYDDLYRYNAKENIKYKNPRTAISGIMNRLDVENFEEYITLVPLKSATFADKMDRAAEIELLSDIYSTRIPINKLYRVISGNYIQVLYQIKMFAEEANLSRDTMPFMYDGVVISYIDKHIIKKLGRKNHVDKYSIALKFPSLSKVTTFRDYFYTVGKDGRITPMAEFDIIEFNGTVHTISSLHSYKRYKELGLFPGEQIQVDYVNDVMPYIKKISDTHCEVPDIICPECGTSATIIKDMAFCKNPNCSGIIKARTTDMLAKLGFDGISISFVERTKLSTLLEVLTLDEIKLKSFGFGTVQIINILQSINIVKGREILDYNYIGSFGFTGISNERFKLILAQYNINELIDICNNKEIEKLVSIRGIGIVIAETIIREMPIFMNDILACMNILNIFTTKGSTNESKGVIKISGFRDDQVLQMLTNRGYDVSYTAVNKNTDYLIVPDKYYKSSKTATAEKYGVKIIFREDVDKILI